MIDKIEVTQTEKNKAILKYGNFVTEAFIGKNGATADKIEGDKKTPLGMFDLGICFGTHDKEELKINNELEYLKINQNQYWVDDSNSKYYN